MSSSAASGSSHHRSRPSLPLLPVKHPKGSGGNFSNKKVFAILVGLDSACQMDEMILLDTDIHAQLQSLVHPASSLLAEVVGKRVGVCHIIYTP